MESKEDEIINLKIIFQGLQYDIKIHTLASYKELCSKIEEVIGIPLDKYLLKIKNQKGNTKTIPSDDPLLNNIYDGQEILILDSLDESCSTIDNECLKINVNFFGGNATDDEDAPIANLTGVLKLCLLKQIARSMTDKQLEKISSQEIKEVMVKLKNEINFTDKTEEDIKTLLSDKEGNNILEYAKYVNEIVGHKDINVLLDILGGTKKEESIKYWRTLSNYQSYNEFFEEEISKSLRNSYFDYSLTSLAILNKQNRKKYEASKAQCPNCVKKILYHGTEIDAVSKILTTEFKYTRQAFYGMGIYFSDMLDYAGFYAGGINPENERINFGRVLPIKSTFSLIATEVYYDNTKFKKVYGWDYYVDPLDHWPTYEELISDYKDKMVQKNGVHFVQVEPSEGQCIEEKDLSEHKTGFVGTEYVVTEKLQMLPIFGLTLEKNEYFILWRDPNFKGQNEFSDFLKEMKIIANQEAKMNIYFESQTEEALKIIERKKYNKMILISSGGKDRGGQKFIEVARKILGFNIVILFFSANMDNLEWIKKLPNVLYTNDCEFYKKYITNFTENGLKKLKKEIEEEYEIKLPEFTGDFMKYPLFKNDGELCKLEFKEKYDFFRHVKIYNQNYDRYLGMDNGNPVVVSKNEADKNIWDITIMGNEITLCCNEYYLMIEENAKNLTGFPYMIRWNISVSNGKYTIFSQENKNDILTIESKNSIKVTNGKDKKNTIFEFIDTD